MTEQLKERARAMWSMGDYPKIARRITADAGEALVNSLEVPAGAELLDVAAGTGNVAIAAGERGAVVTATDLTPALIEQGRERSHAAGLDIAWQVADAEALPFPDHSFDIVTSALGVMFAPNPDIAVRELFRVTRPGGVVAVVSWTPSSSFAATMQAMVSVTPPSIAGAGASPVDWGNEAIVRSWMEPYSTSLETSIGTSFYPFASVQEYVAFTEEVAPPIVAARTALPPEMWNEFHDHHLETIERFARPSAEGGVEVSNEYLIVRAAVR